ncbi:ribosomal protein S5 domain 2-type protein [Vararia minispora EC-137]|uniref:Ribosomal protein S5 domain 2-type protein n=1 Tax=Vararia minispora EC-137 TaxID=1314806 RepID=A0ACB8QUB8_9AGAM|nr:ribosomal protein S5 domain 2-type protein [Vararia minispora EC-137]
MSNLDSFVSHSHPPPECVATSSEITDRESVFVAHIFPASSPVRARAAQAHLKRVVHAKKPATHEMYAYRCMVLKKGRDGLGEDDFEVVEGSEDDREQWAGPRILKIMRSEAVMDAIVVVSRWYGGVMLGPIRFTHIEDCTREVCKAFRVRDEMNDCITALRAYDDSLAKLRTELEDLRKMNADEASSSPDVPEKATVRDCADEPPAKKRRLEPSQDYTALSRSADLVKARRLINARESAMKAVQKLIDKTKTGNAAPS